MNYWPKILVRLLVFGLFLCCGTACQRDEPQPVNLDKRAVLDITTPAVDHLTVCIGSMITPQAGYDYYRKLIDFLATRLQLEIEPIDLGSYEKTNHLLEDGLADFAFVCGGPYVTGHDSFGLELLVAPMVKGQTVYYSYLIVPVESPAQSLSDLRGKTFAFTDPGSNSGKRVPTALLARLGSTPEQFFALTTYTYGHDRSIQAVADKIVDGASVDSLIWDYLAVTQPALTAKTRVIARSGPFGIPPVVVSPQLDPEVRKRLQRVFLAVHEDPQGAVILKEMNIERFVLIEDHAYDGIRALESKPQQKPGTRAAGQP